MLSDTSAPNHAYLGIEMHDDGMGPEMVDTLVRLLLILDPNRQKMSLLFLDTNRQKLLLLFLDTNRQKLFLIHCSSSIICLVVCSVVHHAPTNHHEVALFCTALAENLEFRVLHCTGS